MLLWRTTVPGSVFHAAEAGGTLCVAVAGGLRGLSVSSGKESWSLNGRQVADASVTGAGNVFVVSNQLAVGALDPVTGRQRWRFELPSAEGLPGVSLFAEDSTAVYASGLTADSGKPQSYIFAFDAFTGERKWAAYFPITMAIGPLTAGDGVVCALSGAAGNPNLIALDAQTGVHKWTAPGPAVPFEGAITEGVICGAIAKPDNKSGLVALDVSTGSVLWTTSVTGNLWDTASDAGIMYASTFSGSAQDDVPGELIALNARTGRTLWKHHFPEGIPVDLEPAGAVIYAGTDSGAMHVLDSTTGGVLWSYKITEAPKDQLSVIAPTPNTVYLANLNGALFALQA
jgi:outer membrane protein assembly factor BamB